MKTPLNFCFFNVLQSIQHHILKTECMNLLICTLFGEHNGDYCSITEKTWVEMWNNFL